MRLLYKQGVSPKILQYSIVLITYLIISFFEKRVERIVHERSLLHQRLMMYEFSSTVTQNLAVVKLAKKTDEILDTCVKNGVYKLSRTKLYNFYYMDYAEETTFLYSFRNHLVRQGKWTGYRLFEFFLQYLKYTYLVDAADFLFYYFINLFILPYKLYIIRFSNRSYYFPGPILLESENTAFLFKGLSVAIKKQYETKFYNRFFEEITAFLLQNTDSLLLKGLEHIIDEGLENRAFIHYRWLLHKKQQNKK